MKWNINYKIDYGKKEIKVKTVIFSHPWNGSFNKAILDKVVENLEKTKEKYTIIDLNKDGFSPVMTEKDLELYSQGKSADPLVLKYQEILKNTDELILIFPIWWMSKSAKLITTAEAPKFLLNIMGFGMTMRKANLGGVGIKNTKWIHYSLRAKGKDDDRKKFLEKVGEFVSE